MHLSILKPVLLVITLLALVACASPKPAVDFDAILTAEDIEPERAALLIVRPSDGKTWSHGGARLDSRFVAASTSKIPHSFIALENGYVTGPDMVFTWDGTERWASSWNQDQTMRQAYARSAVWVFQDIARTLGPAVMGDGLRDFDYGNHDIGGPDDLTTYWLSGPLKISAREQVAFLTKLHNETFPLKPQTYAVGKAIMKAAGEANRYAKTGWYYSETAQDIGWYVGWQEYPTPDGVGVYVFAFNMDMDDRDADPPKRMRAVDSALTALRQSEQ